MTQKLTPRAFSVIFPNKINPIDYYIDESFKQTVLLHVCKNKSPLLKSPLILAVQGKKGEGKSSHIMQVCSQLGFHIIYLHGSSIGGQHENVPSDIIKDSYKEASLYTQMGKTAILFIDDIDTSVASTNEDRRYTVNSQLVNGTLMSIADNPNFIGEQEVQRIPIIFTGNDLTNLYSPLRRNGRMKVFSWEPNIETKFKIINSIFQKNINLSELDSFQELIQSYIEKPISFFADLRSELFDNEILKFISEKNTVNFEQINIEISKLIDSKVSFESLKKTAEILSEASFKSYN